MDVFFATGAKSGQNSKTTAHSESRFHACLLDFMHLIVMGGAEIAKYGN